MSIAKSGLKGGQFGTAVKPLHAGLAARNSVDAAMLAAAGMGGRLDVLGSQQGFLHLYGGPNPGSWDDLSFGTTSAIETIGLATRLYPCCGSTHRAVDMACGARITGRSAY